MYECANKKICLDKNIDKIANRVIEILKTQETTNVVKIGNLIWKTNILNGKSLTWNDAKEYAESLGDGWRLPTRAELIDLCDSENSKFLTNIKHGFYWSSINVYNYYPTQAYAINLESGDIDDFHIKQTLYVICVKDYKPVEDKVNPFTLGIER